MGDTGKSGSAVQFGRESTERSDNDREIWKSE